MFKELLGENGEAPLIALTVMECGLEKDQDKLDALSDVSTPEEMIKGLCVISKLLTTCVFPHPQGALYFYDQYEKNMVDHSSATVLEYTLIGLLKASESENSEAFNSLLGSVDDKVELMETLCSFMLSFLKLELFPDSKTMIEWVREELLVYKSRLTQEE